MNYGIMKRKLAALVVLFLLFVLCIAVNALIDDQDEWRVPAPSITPASKLRTATQGPP